MIIKPNAKCTECGERGTVAEFTLDVLCKRCLQKAIDTINESDLTPIEPEPDLDAEGQICQWKAEGYLCVWVYLGGAVLPARKSFPSGTRQVDAVWSIDRPEALAAVRAHLAAQEKGVGDGTD